MEINIPIVIAIAFVTLLVVVFLVYRNLKDEDEYEHEMDDPHALKKHETKDRLEKRI